MERFLALTDPELKPLWSVFFFLTGSIVGSFLNVCIHRIPSGQSVVAPRSRCPHCNALIPWYHNVPVLSYLWLEGRCVSCGHKFSPVYPFVELLTAISFLLLYLYFGISILFFIYAYFICSMIVLIFIDYYHRLLPAVITFPGIALGFLASFVNPRVRPIDSLLGIMVGGLIPTLVLIVYKWVRKREGLGHGDIVLLAKVGAFLGWQQVILVLFASSLIGSIVGILLILVFKKRSDFMLPFGTFIGAAAIAAVFWGPQVWDFFPYFGR
jgi:leader peptidase (prepilin peptidase) / N-methyltransferase